MDLSMNLFRELNEFVQVSHGSPGNFELLQIKSCIQILMKLVHHDTTKTQTSSSSPSASEMSILNHPHCLANHLASCVAPAV